VSHGWTFDNDLQSTKFSATVPTWDAGMFYGYSQWELANGSKLLIPLSNVRTQAFDYDRRLFRAPYGTIWHQEGDERRGVENVNVIVDVVDDADGITDAATLANALAGDAPNVVLIDAPFAQFNVLALTSYSRVPIESGYRFDFSFVTVDGLVL
jgi:hypothetical protein